MNPGQLKKLIEKALKLLGYYKPEAVDLLMITAAQESHCGRYIKQLGDGPACGIFQMEPDTLDDIFHNYTAYRPDLHDLVRSFLCYGDLKLNLTGNLIFQIAIARVHYLRVPEPIPVKYAGEYEYIQALAEYWKKHWNTAYGAGTVEDAVQNYNKYVRKAND